MANHHMILNCKPYIPNQQLLYGKKEDVLCLFPDKNSFENERIKRKKALLQKQEDIKFCTEELEITQMYNSPPIIPYK
ncbi:hypothetical protein KM1_017100 [Entamoeba histolytica HM-3:IMSS]|uniref:Single tm domain protein n=2 Tax=Entamoeba histolytica TaxID=5759 RepID=A0A175JM04_ENTHI|nr:hypothetical protein KM1_017100 [Entamoeba histolytica HM-3:IMSS]GAT94486.1 single tm domain protein [Entamoeba histolytica]